MAVKEDEAASKIVLSKYEVHKTKKAAHRGKGGAARKPKATEDRNASGRRATSTERPPEHKPSPKPTPPSPVGTFQQSLLPLRFTQFVIRLR